MKAPLAQRIYQNIPSAFAAEICQIGFQIDMRETGSWR